MISHGTPTANGTAHDPTRVDAADAHTAISSQVDEALINALISSLPLNKVVEALGGSLAALFDRLASPGVQARRESIRIGAETLVEMRLSGIRAQAVEELGEIVRRGRDGGVTAEEARSLDLLRRACISILRVKPGAIQDSREGDYRGGGGGGGFPESRGDRSSSTSRGKSESAPGSYSAAEPAPVPSQSADEIPPSGAAEAEPSAAPSPGGDSRVRAIEPTRLVNAATRRQDGRSVSGPLTRDRLSPGDVEHEPSCAHRSLVPAVIGGGTRPP